MKTSEVSSAPGMFSARVSSLLPDVAPYAHARYGDSEGGENDARGARSPSAHPPGLSAAVAFLRVPPEGALAVGATASDNRDFFLVEVCHGFVDRFAPGEDLAAAALAGVGSLVGECLDPERG